MVHLLDNLVVLHVVSRGSSSSRKMQRVLGRLHAYLLGAGVHLILSYVGSATIRLMRPVGAVM